MNRNRKTSATAIVDAVAFETQKSQFRGNVFGQQGMYIDKGALKANSAGFDVSEAVCHFNEVQAFLKANGPLKF